jgi:hypothetical protein
MKKQQPKEQLEGPWPVEVIRSRRRRKTVEAKVQNGSLIIRVPAAMSDAELAPVIEKLQRRLIRRATPLPDDELKLPGRPTEPTVLRWGADLAVNSFCHQPERPLRQLQPYRRHHSHQPPAGQDAVLGAEICAGP